MNVSKSFAIGLISIAGIAASSANADVLATLTYDDLAGGYNAGVFTANAVNNAFLRSSGNTSRLVAPGVSSATFEPGFEGGLDPASFNLSLSVVPINGQMASGSGTFTATDRDGDFVTGTISGTWFYPGPGFIFFNGALSNVQLVSVVNSTFDGTAGGAWDMNLPGGPVFSGALVQLVFGGANFFQTPFANRATGITAQIVPSPGSIALIGVAGLVGLRRRR
jgi:hypothetical protein